MAPSSQGLEPPQSVHDAARAWGRPTADATFGCKSHSNFGGLDVAPRVTYFLCRQEAIGVLNSGGRNGQRSATGQRACTLGTSC